MQGKVDAIFVDTGEQNLKNIARRVRVYRVELDQGNANQQIARQPGIARRTVHRGTAVSEHER